MHPLQLLLNNWRQAHKAELWSHVFLKTVSLLWTEEVGIKSDANPISVYCAQNETSKSSPSWMPCEVLCLRVNSIFRVSSWFCDIFVTMTYRSQRLLLLTCHTSPTYDVTNMYLFIWWEIAKCCLWPQRPWVWHAVFTRHSDTTIKHYCPAVHFSIGTDPGHRLYMGWNRQ